LSLWRNVGNPGPPSVGIDDTQSGRECILIPTVINVVNFQPNVAGLALGPGQGLLGMAPVVGGRPVESGWRGEYLPIQRRRRDMILYKFNCAGACHERPSINWRTRGRND